MNHFKEFSSINRFKDVYQSVKSRAKFISKDEETGEVYYDKSRTKPVISFYSTVKIHGTNAGVSLHRDGKMYAQSRKRILSQNSDNAGFWQWSIGDETRRDYFHDILETFMIQDPNIDQVVVFGEVAGQGIQKGVAISQVPKHFYPFQVQVLIDEDWYILDLSEVERFHDKELNIIPITTFAVHRFDIDFNDDAQIDEQLQKIQELCDEVERECPVGKYHGVEGIGEGVVLSTEDGHHYFKVKGDKHKHTKNQIAKTVNEEDYKDLNDFAQTVTSEARLEQGTQVLKERGMEPTSAFTKEYLDWVWQDIIKEESEAIKAKGFDEKVLRKTCTKHAIKFYQNFKG